MQRTRETDEELADVLTAISVVAKRLARKLRALAIQEEGVQEDGKDGDREGRGAGHE